MGKNYEFRRYFFTKEMYSKLKAVDVEDGEICSLLFVSKDTFFRWKKYDNSVLDFTKDMYLKFKSIGMSDIEIRALFKTSKRTFLKWKKKHGLEAYRGDVYTFSFEEIKTLWHEGISFNQIARMKGVSVGGLWGWIKRHEEKGYKL